MKHFILWCCLAAAGSVCALPLSQEAQQEAQLFNDFLNATYAQHAGDSKRFELLQRALEQSPDSAYIKRQLVAEALAVNNTHLAQAYIDFIDQDAEDPEAWMVYAAYQWQTDHTAKALEAYEKALELDPDNEQILLQYLPLLAATNPQKANQMLVEQAQSRPLVAPYIYTEIGRMYLNFQQYSAALEAFNKAISLDEKMPEPRLGRASVYEKTSQYFLMLHELEELEQMGYTTPYMLAQMGSVFVLVKDLARAKQYFLRAKEKQNDLVSANYFLALFAEDEGDYESAILYLQDSADYNDSPAKQLQVGFYQRKLGWVEESLATLKQAHARFPDSAEAAYFYAVALYENGQYKKSARVLAPVVEKLPDNAEVRLQYAFALEAQKKYKEMDEQLNALLAQHPQNAGALNLYAYSLALRWERLEEAADYIARALAIDPENDAFLDTQAWVFFKQGKYAQAADIIKEIPEEVLSSNPEMAYHAAYIYEALKDHENAVRMFQLGCGERNPKQCLKEFQKIR